MNDNTTDTERTEETTTDAEADDLIDLYHLQRHRNGDVTAVLLLSFGSGHQALALDVDAGGQILETEEIGDNPDRDKAVGMIEYWLDQHPEGILGGAPEGGGLLARLFGRGDES